MIGVLIGRFALVRLMYLCLSWVGIGIFEAACEGSRELGAYVF